MEAVLSGEQEQVKLESDVVRIGRASDNNVILLDPKVSSHHAEIRLEGQQYNLIDLGSKNGTFINNKRLAHNMPQALSNFDQLLFGDTKYTFEVTNTSFSEPTMYAPLPSYDATILAPPPSNTPDVAQSSSSQGGRPYEPTQRAPLSSSAFGAGTPPKYQERQPIASPAEEAPSPSSTVKKGGKGKIVLALLGVVLVVLIVGFFVFNGMKGGSQALSGPAATLTNYCNALKTQDYTTAYNLLDDNAKGQYSLDDLTLSFNSNGGEGKVKSCTVNIANNTTSSPANIALNFTYDNNATKTTTYTLVGAGNDWKITNEKVSSPDETLTTYCQALGKQNFRLAYNQLSSAAKGKVSEKTFVNQLSSNGVTGCQATKAQENGSTATSTVTYVATFGVTRDAPTTLINELGTWKIEDQK